MIPLDIFERIIEGVTREIARQVTQTGGEIVRSAASEAIGGVVEVGKRELSQGVDSYKKKQRLAKLKSNPAQLSMEITNLAKRNKGELTTAQVMTEFEMDEPSALSVFQNLENKDICIRRGHREKLTFIFPGFKTKQRIYQCEYCGNSFMPKDVSGSNCLTCGAPMIESVTYV